MPRPFSDYDVGDWLRLRPPLDAMRSWRIARATDAFARQPPRTGHLAAIQRATSGRRAMVTIAFNDPEILGRQIRAVRAFVPGPVHIVADNSSNPARAAEIETLCRAEGVAYLRLPRNPWGPRSPSRSHGAALNWVWRRLIKPARPAAFGFLDHDIAPLAPDDPFAALERQPVAGDKRWTNDRWFLWAGYCFFRIEVFDTIEADFGQDWPISLDTGGGNWRALYSRLDPDQILQRPIENVGVFSGGPTPDCFFERRGVWLHEQGPTAGRPEFTAAKRAHVLALIDDALAAAAARARTPPAPEPSTHALAAAPP